MDGAHAHLLFNHFPIIGSILSVLVLLAGFIIKNGIVKKTAMAMIVFTAVMTVPAFLTGEPAEEVLEAINQAPDAIIHEHEEMAEKGLWTTIAVGALALFAFVSSKKPIGPKLMKATLVLLIANTFFLIQIGNAGGEIRHTEIRTGGTVNAPVDGNLEVDDKD
ncbi:MAG: hypothetical protein IPL24_03715 [Bacteroidetes bacterium]|nr:hypothetical protein [Bacteroidota bacterium]MBK8362799.1 hypothetical protein [Bacteroidota bacterium]